jgi:hypothetical protein
VGRLEIEDGTLQALPILNKVALYFAEPKYRTLEVQKFECDFEKFREQTHLRNIILSSRGLLQIEGDLKIDGNKLDGLFDVGVPAAYLDKIPGAKTSVFKPGKDSLLWTQVKIGGDFDDITEDLSDRLIQAAFEDMMRRGLDMGIEAFSPETIEKYGGKDVLKNLNDVLKGDKGVIEGGLDTAKGLLDGITGSKKEENDEKKDDEKDDDEEKKKEDEGLIPDLPKVPDLDKILPFL